MLCVKPSLPAGAALLLLGEAIAAVDRPVLARQEWDLAGVATAGADRVVHLAGAAVVAAAAAAVAAAAAATATAPSLTAGRAALGVLVSSFRVELLIIGAKDELRVTLNTRKVTILVGHSMTSFLSPGLRSGHRAEAVAGESTRRTLTSSTTSKAPTGRGHCVIEGTIHREPW
jgi:hypothetical protein